MATEYKDGRFGETLPIDEAMEEFIDACNVGTAKAMHVGTYAEVEASKESIKFRNDIQDIIGEMNARIREIEENSGHNKSIIQKPTWEDILKVKNDE
jgi:hypothetical protein